MYCCNSASYEKHCLDQVSHGQYFSGAAFQRGYGLENIFPSLGKPIQLLVQFAAKAIGKQALKSVVAFASNVLAGKNVKQAAFQRTKQAGSTLLRQVTASKNERLPKYKRKNVKNITTFLLRQW